MVRPEVRVLEDAETLARTAAELFAEAGLQAVASRGRFVAVLAGGSTPARSYRLLADEPLRSRVPWPSTVILFGDERAVGPADERSNYRMAREALLDHVPLAASSVHRIRGEIDPAAAAREYEGLLRDLFPGGATPRFDLVLLGMGEDGHTASLFPASAALDETERWVSTSAAPRLATPRITLTLPALNAARQVVFLIAGASKAPAFAQAFGGAPHATPHPCERVVPVRGRLTVLVDRAAARR